jgi:hypothetical protein
MSGRTNCLRLVSQGGGDRETDPHTSVLPPCCIPGPWQNHGRTVARPVANLTCWHWEWYHLDASLATAASASRDHRGVLDRVPASEHASASSGFSLWYPAASNGSRVNGRGALFLWNNVCPCHARQRLACLGRSEPEKGSEHVAGGGLPGQRSQHTTRQEVFGRWLPRIVPTASLSHHMYQGTAWSCV